ncbi:hypothetical protein DBV15_03179 [Temnothorax longispinosus]|uniref:Uncharacterized protein n=1 Tax=Temnothorax longispinosus TaxID=300112 RepID=A0A4S2KNA4_9HYME|nr:hypothetical protein DBV15_03179 [Temnothorax longispinosus]
MITKCGARVHSVPICRNVSVDPKTKRDFEQREARKWERASDGTLPSSSAKTKTTTTTTTTATLAGRQEQPCLRGGEYRNVVVAAAGERALWRCQGEGVHEGWMKSEEWGTRIRDGWLGWCCGVSRGAQEDDGGSRRIQGDRVESRGRTGVEEGVVWVLMDNKSSEIVYRVYCTDSC